MSQTGINSIKTRPVPANMTNLLPWLVGPFLKSADKMPTISRFWLIVLFAVLLFLSWVAYCLPQILHEAPATIRALKEAGAAPLAAPLTTSTVGF